MAIDLKIPDPTEPKKLTVRIDGDVYAELESYLACAQDGQANVTLDILVEHMLADRMKKDRGFRTWLAEQKRKPDQEKQKPALASVANGDSAG